MTTTPLSLAEYQELARRTVTDERVYSYEYLIPAIVGEVGELFGHRAKAFWHGDWSNLQTELVSEYGDICWMTAILLYREGVDSLDGHYFPTAHRPQPWHAILSKANDLSLMWTEPEANRHIWRCAMDMWGRLSANCQAITGKPFSDVLRANADKLADRAARGVLKGNGDHR